MSATTKYRPSTTSQSTSNFDQSAISDPKSAIKGGWINAFYRTNKEKRLGPYYVRRWKENGRIRKQYIKSQNVVRVRSECQSYRQS